MSPLYLSSHQNPLADAGGHGAHACLSSVPVSILRVIQANLQSTLWVLQHKGSSRHICIRRQHLVIWPFLGSFPLQMNAFGRISVPDCGY